MRKPLIKRWSELLERHGLSFGDTLNLALFGLTILSVLLAVAALYLAKKTLDDAHQSGIEQASLFKSEIEQSQKTAADLELATDLLSKQGYLLGQLQTTSQLQLSDLNKAEDRFEKQEHARPLPTLNIECNGYNVINLAANEKTHGGQIPTKIIPMLPIYGNDLQCNAFAENHGDLDLKRATLTVQVLSNLQNNGYDASIVKVKSRLLPAPETDVTLFRELDIPPTSLTEIASGASFVLRPQMNSSAFILQVNLESLNFRFITAVERIQVMK